MRHLSPLGVKHFEIWNEPNISNFWKPAPDIAHYTRMLIAAYDAMKAVDPSITVMAGAFSPYGGPGDNSGDRINPVDFLAGIYANGGGGHFDAVSHHPYDRSNDPGESTHQANAWYQVYGSSPSLRSLMVANGDGNKQIWGTEYGNSLDWVSQEVVDRRISMVFRNWFAIGDFVGPFMYYSYHGHDSFALTRSDWSPRSSWTAFRNAPK